MFGGNNQNQWGQPQNNMASPFNAGATQGFGGQATQGFGGAPTPGFGGATSGFGGQQQPSTFGGAQNQAAPGFGFGNAPQQQQPQNSLFGGGAQTQGFGGAANFGGNTQQKIYQTDKFEVELPHQFTDSVSHVIIQKLATGTNQGRYICAAAGWDGKLQLFEIVTDQNQHAQNNYDQGQINPPMVNPGAVTQMQGPILGICYMDQIQQQSQGFGFGAQMNSGSKQPHPIFIAHSDCTIKLWDPNNPTNPAITIGSHTQPVKDIYSFSKNGQFFLASGGWDCVVKFWQVQGNMPNVTLTEIGQSWIGKPIHQLSGQFPLLVTSHSEKFIHLWNLENIFQGNFNPVHVAESPLRFTSSAIACFGDGKGYAVGSIEGRCGIVNVDFTNITKVDTRDFCFKCHRQEDTHSKEGDVYTVNCISYNKTFNTFVTVGSDGHWFTWNKDTKSRYKQSQKSQMPITSAAFSEDGIILVHAHGEDWTLGGASAQKRPNNIKLFVRRCERDDVFKAPKNK